MGRWDHGNVADFLRTRLARRRPLSRRLRPDADDRALVEAIAGIAFSDFEMRGVVARRRVAFFSQSYDRAAVRALPAFLLPLRAKIAHWSGIDFDAVAKALSEEYRSGTPIGWPCDAPNTASSSGSCSCRPVQ
jgi:hypothetical protein